MGVAVLAWCGLHSGVDACSFEFDIDPYTQYYGLEPDYSAYSSEDCSANCCADPSCDVWQYTDQPVGGVANCMHGVSYDYGDSGGIYWTGESGRQDGPDPGDGGAGGHGKKKKKCRGVHCDAELDGTLFLILFGSVAGAYLVSGTYYGVAVQKKSGIAALPNAGFWMELGGLVKDGMAFTVSGGTAKGIPRQPYAAVPDVEAPVGVAVPPVGMAVQPSSVASPRVTFVNQEPKKKKVRVKREKSSKAKKARPSTSRAVSSGASSLE